MPNYRMDRTSEDIMRELTAILRTMGKLGKEERAQLGANVNKLKQELEASAKLKLEVAEARREIFKLQNKR